MTTAITANARYAVLRRTIRASFANTIIPMQSEKSPSPKPAYPCQQTEVQALATNGFRASYWVFSRRKRAVTQHFGS